MLIVNKFIYFSFWTIVILNFTWATALNGQQTISAAGGNVMSSAGSVSYTIGQTFFTTHSGTSGSVAEGVQHPYETLVVSVTDQVHEIFHLNIFPNPTADFLIIENTAESISEYRLFLQDISGRLLEERKLSGAKELLEVNHLIPGTYFLTIFNSEGKSANFKILKK